MSWFTRSWKIARFAEKWNAMLRKTPIPAIVRKYREDRFVRVCSSVLTWARLIDWFRESQTDKALTLMNRMGRSSIDDPMVSRTLAAFIFDLEFLARAQDGYLRPLKKVIWNNWVSQLYMSIEQYLRGAYDLGELRDVRPDIDWKELAGRIEKATTARVAFTKRLRDDAVIDEAIFQEFMEHMDLPLKHFSGQEQVPKILVLEACRILHEMLTIAESGTNTCSEELRQAILYRMLDLSTRINYFGEPNPR